MKMMKDWGKSTYVQGGCWILLILFRTLLHLITQEISLRFPTRYSSVKSQSPGLSLGNRDTKVFYGSVRRQAESRTRPTQPWGFWVQTTLFFLSLYCFVGCDNDWRTSCTWRSQSSRGGRSPSVVWVQAWLCCRNFQHFASFTVVLHKVVLTHWRIKLLNWRMNAYCVVGKSEPCN